MGKVALRKQVRAEVEQNVFVVEIARRPYACVVSFTWHNGVLWSDAGFSKANWPDWYSEKFGIEIARGRALDGIVRQITGEKKREKHILTAEDLYQVTKLRILENQQRDLETALGVESEAMGPSPIQEAQVDFAVAKAISGYHEAQVETRPIREWQGSAAPWLPPAGQSARSIEEAPLDQ
jgi:hypothetical protein